MSPKITLAQAVSAAKGILFDCYHTLTALEVTTPDHPMTYQLLGVSEEAWVHELMENSHDRLSGKLKDGYEIIRGMALQINPGLSEETIRRAAQNRFRRFELSLLHMPASSVETVRVLHQAGKKNALVSNADVTETVGWEEGPARPHFDVTIFSCDVGWVKPEREIYELALSRLGLKASECLFVGDGGSRELEGAKKLGLTTVFTSEYLFGIPETSIAERRRWADFEIGRLAQLSEALAER